MSAPTRCPDSAALRDLLEGSSPEPEQEALVSHLDECTSCQQSLEALASNGSAFVPTVLERPALQTPEPSSAYWPALQNAEDVVTVEAPRSRSPISLAFLDPPENPAHLGKLGTFNIVRIVGRGGMGVVFQAIDTCLQREVAIKILDPDLAQDDLAAQRFCREAQIAAKINHENVVSIHYVEHDKEKDLPYLVMELVSGESLEKRLQREGKLSLKDIVSIGMQTAAGLAAAHEKDLIHRDIKPGNILLEKSGQRVKLTDFGLARATEDVRLTRSGLVAGTPLYMSPEQASGNELDARSDLFSLGVVLYELAAGEPPFNGKTPLVVLRRVTEEQPRPLRERNPELPEWFADIVDRLLAKKPEDRFQSAREVADVLQHFWALLKSSTDNLECPKKKAAAHLMKAIGLGVAAGVVTLMLGMLMAFYLLPARNRPEEPIPNPVHLFKGSADPLWSMAVSQDGKWLATGNDDGSVQLWDVNAERVHWTLNAHKGPVWTLALSPGGNHLATGGDDGHAKVWDLKTQEEVHALANVGGVRAVAFDPEGKKLLTGDRNGMVKLWDLNSPSKEVLRTVGHASLVVAVAFAADGKTMASASSDKTIKIWDVTREQAKLTLRGHDSGVYGIAFSPNGRYLVSGGWDRTVRLWDLDSGNQLAKLEGHTQPVWAAAFNPEGTLFASSGEDQMVRVWSVESRKEVGAFRGSQGAILNLRFSPKAGHLIAGGKDGTARIWNLADLQIPR